MKLIDSLINEASKADTSWVKDSKSEKELMKVLKDEYGVDSVSELKDPTEILVGKYTMKLDSRGNCHWRLNSKIHREDGPAIEWVDGTNQWVLNGKLHRVDGPAIEWASGTKEWWLNGQLHRVDGPAVEGSSGSKEWFLNGKQFSEEEFDRITR